MKLKRVFDAAAPAISVNHLKWHFKNQPQIRDKRIRAVLDAMENDLRHSWTTQEFGRLVSLSPSHLRQLFRVETGKTPNQHLKELRMHAAKVLLESEYISVKEVMDRVGIPNPSHFVKDFKGTYGVSPSMIKKSKSSARAVRRHFGHTIVVLDRSFLLTGVGHARSVLSIEKLR